MPEPGEPTTTLPVLSSAYSHRLVNVTTVLPMNPKWSLKATLAFFTITGGIPIIRVTALTVIKDALFDTYISNVQSLVNARSKISTKSFFQQLK